MLRRYGFDARYINAKAFLKPIFRPDDRFPHGTSASEFLVIASVKIEGATRAGS